MSLICQFGERRKTSCFSEVPYKLSPRGRDSCSSRPQFVLLAAAVRATFGRRQQIFSGNEMTFFIFNGSFYNAFSL